VLNSLRSELDESTSENVRKGKLTGKKTLQWKPGEVSDEGDRSDTGDQKGGHHERLHHIMMCPCKWGEKGYKIKETAETARRGPIWIK